MAKKRRRRRRRRGGSNWGTTVAPFLLLGVLLIGGYVAYLVLHKGGREEAVCALVIDRTTSVSSPATVSHYRDLADATIRGCSELNAGLYIYAFDQQGSKVQLVSRRPFELWGVGNKSSKREASRQEQIKQARQAIDDAFKVQSEPTRGSDIVTALHSAADNLNSDAARAGVSSKYLVVLSDGIQSSDDISLAGLSSGNAPTAPIISRVHELGLMPAFEGAKVSFAGVQGGLNAKTGEQLPQVFEANVKSFWTALVHDGHGHLCTYIADTTALPRNC